MVSTVIKITLMGSILAALLISVQACGSSPGKGLPTLRIWLDQPETQDYARVYLDKKLVSSALRHDRPVDINVKWGEHTIEVELEGYGRVTERIEAHETLIQEFHIVLKKE